MKNKQAPSSVTIDDDPEEVVNYFRFGTPFVTKIRHPSGSPSQHAKIIIEPTGTIEFNYDQFLRWCSIVIGTVDISKVI